MNDKLGFFRLAYRLPCMLLHLLIGTPPVVLCQTAPGRAIRIGDKPLSEVMSHWWVAVICWIFGLRVRVDGEFPDGPQLVAANHISWIDISCCTL